MLIVSHASVQHTIQNKAEDFDSNYLYRHIHLFMHMYEIIVVMWKSSTK